MSTTTLDQVRADLAREGFTAELVADGHALRVATSPDRRHSLDDVAVARLVRVADPAGAPPPGG